MTAAQSQLLARRQLLTGALVFAVSLPALRASRARAAHAFDGSWGGVDAQGETAQLIFANGAIIGFYWRGDYMDARDVSLRDGGASVSFAYLGGKATATRNGERGLTLVIRDSRLGESRLELKKD
jgi:hypothetical protein